MGDIDGLIKREVRKAIIKTAVIGVLSIIVATVFTWWLMQ